MIEKVQDLYLPNAVIGRIIKDALPDGISVAKEARSAISSAASVFVLYLTSMAAANERKKNVKTLTADHVLDALKTLEFENFIEPLRQSLEEFRKANKDKRTAKGNASAKANGTSASSSENASEQMIEE